MSEDPKERTGRTPEYTGLGLAFGAGVGLVFGTAFGNTAIGLIFGGWDRPCDWRWPGRAKEVTCRLTCRCSGRPSAAADRRALST